MLGRLGGVSTRLEIESQTASGISLIHPVALYETANSQELQAGKWNLTRSSYSDSSNRAPISAATTVIVAVPLVPTHEETQSLDQMGAAKLVETSPDSAQPDYWWPLLAFSFPVPAWLARAGARRATERPLPHWLPRRRRVLRTVASCP